MTERADQLHRTMRLPILQLSCKLFFFFFCKASRHPDLSAPLQPKFGSLQLLAFTKAKIAVEREEICECNGHIAHKLTHRRLTADWLAPWESDCPRMYSKVSSDWLPSYIKATRLVREIFKIVGYFPDSPCVCVCVCNHITNLSLATHGVCLQTCKVCSWSRWFSESQMSRDRRRLFVVVHEASFHLR